jgi:hypothetical protein
VASVSAEATLIAGGAFDTGRGNSGKFAQHGIDERCGGTFACAFDQLHALINGSTCGNASEPAELINGESKSGKNLEIEFGD